MFSNASSLSSRVDNIFLYVLAITAAILLFITFLMICFVIRYSKKRNSRPENIEGNYLLELVWTCLPTLLVLSMFYYGWDSFKKFRTVPKDAVNIKVTAMQWSWLFTYENGKQSSILKVPLHKPVRLSLYSSDVIHSFYVPVFRLKEDVLPGTESFTWFQAEMEGFYDILCAEYCGQRHSYMMSKVEVLTGKEFKAWMERKAVSSGSDLYTEKGCVGCHTLDGSPLAGPTFKGLFGRREKVMTDGKEREIVIDEKYIRRSLMYPAADIVIGYEPLMPRGLVNEEDIEEIIKFLKTL